MNCGNHGENDRFILDGGNRASPLPQNRHLNLCKFTHELQTKPKVGRILSKMRQTAFTLRFKNKKRARQSIGASDIEERQDVISRIAGAIVRAAFVVLLIATPALLLPNTSTDTSQIVALIAMAAGGFALMEYSSACPSLIEFRDAPPYNRTRFLSLFIAVFLLSMIARGATESTTLSMFVTAMGYRLGALLDFPYSPVRLMVLMLPQDAPASLGTAVRTAAAVAYVTSILSLAYFVLCLRVHQWPGRNSSLNIWTNLPTFDPTTGEDIVGRLQRDSQINLIVGFLLPFLVPAIVKLGSSLINPASLSDPHTLIWMVSAWAFIPSSLLMRGIAMGRVAQMIEDKRKRASSADSLQPA